MNLVDAVIERFAGPSGGSYATRTVHRRGVRLPVSGFLDVEIAVDDGATTSPRHDLSFSLLDGSDR